MSYKSLNLETDVHHAQSNGWELETAVGASFTWNCDQTQGAAEEQEKDPCFNEDASIHATGASDIDPRQYEDHQIDEDRDISLMELQEDIGLRTPLEMRELPDLTHSFATWNVCNGFEADKIAGIMLRCNLSILAIQEPRVTFDEIDLGFSTKVLLQHGIKGFFTKHHIVQKYEYSTTKGGANCTKDKRAGDHRKEIPRQFSSISENENT